MIKHAKLGKAISNIPNGVTKKKMIYELSEFKRAKDPR